jgi:hypothetical protein
MGKLRTTTIPSYLFIYLISVCDFAGKRAASHLPLLLHNIFQTSHPIFDTLYDCHTIGDHSHNLIPGHQ